MLVQRWLNRSSKSFVDENPDEFVVLPRFAQLDEETFAQIAGAHAGWIQVLHDVQHRLHFAQGDGGEHPLQFLRGLDLTGVEGVIAHLFKPGVEVLGDLLQRAAEEAVIVDVADDFLRDPLLALGECQQLKLALEMVAEVGSSGRRGHVEVTGFVLRALSAGIEPVEQDGFPVDLVVSFVRGFLVELYFLLGVALDHLQKRVFRHLLLETLLQVEEWKMKQLHRLVQARVDLHLLPELLALDEPRSETAHAGTGGSKRLRMRSVRTGPR